MDFEKLVLIYIILFTVLATGFAAALLENAKLTRENERLKKMSEFLYEQVQILWMRCEQRGVETEREEEGRNMKYQVCEHCGAHLDHGEKCDCQDER